MSSAKSCSTIAGTVAHHAGAETLDALAGAGHEMENEILKRAAAHFAKENVLSK